MQTWYIFSKKIADAEVAQLDFAIRGQENIC